MYNKCHIQNGLGQQWKNHLLGIALFMTSGHLFTQHKKPSSRVSQRRHISIKNFCWTNGMILYSLSCPQGCVFQLFSVISVIFTKRLLYVRFFLSIFFSVWPHFIYACKQPFWFHVLICKCSVKWTKSQWHLCIVSKCGICCYQTSTNVTRLYECVTTTVQTPLEALPAPVEMALSWTVLQHVQVSLLLTYLS